MSGHEGGGIGLSGGERDGKGRGASKLDKNICPVGEAAGGCSGIVSARQ